MHKDPEKTPVDAKKYAPGLNDPEIKYGLPSEIDFCGSCAISNQRPNSAVEFKHTAETKKATIHLDEDGVCDACKVSADKKKNIDWTERDRELRDLCDRFRSKDGSYDCLVPGSGGKDEAGSVSGAAAPAPAGREAPGNAAAA